MLGLVIRKLPPPLRALVLTALGGYLLWGGIRAWTGPAECNDREMPAGALCVHSDGSTSTVADMLHQQHVHGWAPFLTGMLFLGVAVYTILRPRRLRG
ncbi:hypothetical protein [Catenulispora subtropica]|uniref:Integral membrane protein n=1 Tax=Catenulispora subtropica TaxID=450798 RepID=A0ABP5EKG5_9ACTN